MAKPTFNAYSVREYENDGKKDSFWTKILAGIWGPSPAGAERAALKRKLNFNTFVIALALPINVGASWLYRHLTPTHLGWHARFCC